ncbi:MAG: glycosyltransferase family 2 protein [Alphaproteobacteria bacterium]|nr:glycosyltransferase family 2 protein [Alphaproteobacteria bacterium]
MSTRPDGPASALPLVSVIVPAFDAEATLAETLRSALAQTWPNIEVIVVDDGSTDRTAGIAARFEAEDGRVTLLRKDHGGVSSARNLAIAHARGDYVAPLDADDLWHPTKIEKQVEAARRGAVPPGFVYTLFRRIDMAGHVCGSGPQESLRGLVVHRHLHRNFVGNGSAMLIRRDALLEAGGYDERLLRGEDYLLQLRIASRHRVEIVPEYLVGYRLSPGSLSSDWRTALPSWTAIRRLVRETCPGPAHEMDVWMHGRRCFDFAENAAWQRRYPAAAALLLRALWADPLRTSANLAYRLARRRLRRGGGASPAAPGPSFEATSPSEAPAADPYAHLRAARWLRRLDERRMARLARLDEAYEALEGRRAVSP